LNLLARIKPETAVSKIVEINRQLSRVGTGKAPFGGSFCHKVAQDNVSMLGTEDESVVLAAQFR
jgi:hypothetical protein